jgi:hypothetical protein
MVKFEWMMVIPKIWPLIKCTVYVNAYLVPEDQIINRIVVNGDVVADKHLFCCSVMDWTIAIVAFVASRIQIEVKYF